MHTSGTAYICRRLILENVFMQNNVVLRQIRYIFDYSDAQMIQIFEEAEVTVNRAEVSNWLKKEEDEDYAEIEDVMFAAYLNGLINHKRGKKEGPQAPLEKRLNNNIVFRKLRIALNFKDTDILELFEKVSLRISKHELSAFFRKPDHKDYRACEDQFLRNFLFGLQKKHRPESKATK